MKGSLVDTVRWCRPTLFFGVPRIWEKFEDRLREFEARNVIPHSDWAKQLGHQKVRNQMKGKPPGPEYDRAVELVLRKLQDHVGLD